MRGAFVLCAAAILCGAVSGAALSAPGPKGTRDFNPNAAGPLVEYLIHSDGTGRIEINGPGPISGYASFQSLSRSRDGFRFRLGPGLSVGTTETLGSPPRQLPVPGLIDELALGAASPSDWPSFSADGNWLAATGSTCPDCSSACETNCVEPQVWVVRTDGTDAHEVAPHGHSPSWSGNGKWLAFTWHLGNYFGGSEGGVYVVRRDGTGLRQIAKDGSGAVFAPRGDLIAYDCGPSRDPTGVNPRRADVCVSKRDGTGRRVLARLGRFFHPFVWSPDAKKLAIVTRDPRSETGAGRLLVVRVDDGRPETIVRDLHPYAPAAWSPDQQSIAYTRMTDQGPIVRIASIAAHRSWALTSDIVSLNDVRWMSNTRLTYLTYQDTTSRRP